MMAPEIPADEQARLAALQELRILDTPPEERFDRITRIACDLFQVPIALVSLVDADRQWFKSRAGLDASETPRSVSFCGHAILGAAPFVVENAREDERFADNPLVTGHPDIRFYAGMPLQSKTGRMLGTLCLIDSKPRHFSREDALRLGDLAAWAERELNLSVQIEGALADMRETFVRLVSHELRTPVTSFVGALGLIRSGDVDKATIDALLGMATESAGKLQSIVDEIVEIAEIDAGQQDLTPQEIHLQAFLEAAMESYLDEAKHRQVELKVEAAEDLVIHAPLRPLTKILRALVNNAVRFSPPETIVTIAAARASPEMIRISVTDQGPGIPPEHIPRLFQPFAQVDASDSRKHEGIGASLAICHRLATAMGGHLGYEPVAGGGSRFFLDLPAR